MKEARTSRFNRYFLIFYVRFEVAYASWLMLFANEVYVLVGEKAVITWDRSSRGDLRYWSTLSRRASNTNPHQDGEV